MLQLDMVLFSALKRMQSVLGSEGISIWLLNHEGTELECTHAVGTQAVNLLGSSTRAKKFVSICRVNETGVMQANEPLSKWMRAKLYREYFERDAKLLLVMPLAAREEIVGVVIATKRAGSLPFVSDDLEFVRHLSSHMAAAIQNTQLYERRNHTTERQKLLDQISRHLHQTLNLDELMPRIFAEVNKAIQAEAQSIWLMDEATNTIKCHFASGPESEMLAGFSISLAESSIVGTSVLRKESIIIKDAKKDPRRARSADAKTGFVTRSLMTVPLVLEEKAIGAIQAVNKQRGGLFGQTDLELFRSIADSAALAVNNAQLVADLQKSYDLTLAALSSALDLRDRETVGHSMRVVEYTARLAEQVGLDKESVNTIRRGALIHDIGKIGVPDAILNKPGALNKEERAIIERHPQIGYYILVGIPYLKEELQLVIYHHERWDGKGYPQGFGGEDIPLGARLFSIADTFDALTSDRSYRKGNTYEAARRVIEEESGRQFDPQAVAAFLSIPPEEWVLIRAKVNKEITRQQILKEGLVRSK